MAAAIERRLEISELLSQPQVADHSSIARTST